MATRSPTHRYVSVLVRTAHLASVVGVFSSALAGAPWGPWVAPLGISGLLLIGDDLWRFGVDWLRFLQAWVVLGKLGIFLIFAAHDAPVAGLWIAFLLGSIISHAPGELRHLPLFGDPGPCGRAKTATKVG